MDRDTSAFVCVTFRASKIIGQNISIRISSKRIACNFLLHKRCQSRVFAGCVDKTLEGDEEDEDHVLSAIKHRIPHRFEPASNVSVTWCIHCGTMITALTKRPVLKCSECNVCCHTQCSTLVPDFCGLSQEMLNQLRYAVNASERLKKVRSPPKSTRAGASPAPSREASQPIAPPLSKQTSSMGPASGKGLQFHMTDEEEEDDEFYDTNSSPTRSQNRLSFAYPPDINAVTPRPSDANRSNASSPQLATPIKKQGFKQSSMVVSQSVGLEDFNFLAVLGKGNFGKVDLLKTVLGISS